MSAFPRASVALGVAAALMAAVSAHAIDAGSEAVTQQAVALVSDGVAAKPAADPSCPTVTLAPDGDTRRVDGAKASLDGLARDCANLGAETIVKVALVGEGERRAKNDGKASAIDAPMTIQVKDGEGREVEIRRINLKVEMPEGVQKVAFRHVEENVSLPPPTADGYANWTIVVGLDPSAEPEQAIAAIEEEDRPVAKTTKRSRKARSRAVKRARSVASRQAPAPQPEPNPVVVSAKPAAAPATVTTSTTGGAMARAAQSFTERRDAALQDQRMRAAQQAAQARRQQGQPAQQPQARPAPQPQAAAPQQPAIRTANR